MADRRDEQPAGIRKRRQGRRLEILGCGGFGHGAESVGGARSLSGAAGDGQLDLGGGQRVYGMRLNHSAARPAPDSTSSRAAAANHCVTSCSCCV